MLLAACEDTGMNETLDMILSLPDDRRQDLVLGLLERFREAEAPSLLFEAFVPLLDNEVAERAYEVIYDCKRRLE